MTAATALSPKPRPVRPGGQPIPSAPTQMHIDPTTAAAWLQRNVHNRNLREEAVAALARDMAAGRWQYTGEAIKFSESGNLLDGQHRLAAVVKAQTTITSLVVPGLPDNVQDVMDTGAKRTAADVLNLAGETNPSIIAAAARIAICFEVNGLTRKVAVTHAEILSWLSSHPEMRDAAAAARRHQAIPLGVAVIAYGLWRLRQIDQAEADEFFTDLTQMRTEGKGDPRAALLQRLNSARTGRERMTHAAQLSLVFRAWNAVRKGQPVTLLKVAYNGGAVEVPHPA